MTLFAPCCLVAEDQPLIGLALKAYLEEHSFVVAGPFARNADALAWLEQNTPDLALLDVVLADGFCIALARALQERGVPFATRVWHRAENLPTLDEIRQPDRWITRMERA